MTDEGTQLLGEYAVAEMPLMQIIDDLVRNCGNCKFWLVGECMHPLNKATSLLCIGEPDEFDVRYAPSSFGCPHQRFEGED